MAKIVYKEKRFKPETAAIIEQANAIIEEYAKEDIKLTLRGLYYQFVSRDYLANTPKNYDRLGTIISDARIAGLVDWDSIEDRGRKVKGTTHWDQPQSIIDAVAAQYRIDKWQGQQYRPEVWIEKEALAGVIERVCSELDISYLSCKGYTSQSEMHSSGMRLKRIIEDEQTPVILHFGDHDPSGIDMTRDIMERLNLFVGEEIEIRRLALNMPQIALYKPPPNPAKTTDARFGGYESKYGTQSWELDALEPRVLVKLVRDEVKKLRQDDLYDARAAEEAEQRQLLSGASLHWDKVTKLLTKLTKEES